MKTAIVILLGALAGAVAGAVFAWVFADGYEAVDSMIGTGFLGALLGRRGRGRGRDAAPPPVTRTPQ
ncbi:hypothetical protein ACFY36_31655 [Actinoplanes sp. NPDC000266]